MVCGGRGPVLILPYLQGCAELLKNFKDVQENGKASPPAVKKAKKAASPKPTPIEHHSETEDEYEVEQILKQRGAGPSLQFFVKWKGYSSADATWESAPKLKVLLPVC